MNNGVFSTRKPKLYSSIYDQKPVSASTQPPVGAIGQDISGKYIMPKSPQPTPQPKIETPRPELTPIQETANLQNEAANTNVKYITDLYNQRAKTYQAQVDPMKERFNQYKQAQQEAIQEAEKAAEAERQAQEQQYGGELRQSAQAGRESRARVANEFAGYNTLDSSAYGKALVGQEDQLRREQANIRATQSRAGLQTQRELSSFKREANNAIANEASKLQDKLNEIDQLLGEGSIEKDRAIAEAYQTARTNILKVRQELAAQEREINKYNLSETYVTTGQPTTMADYIFRATNTDEAKKLDALISGKITGDFGTATDLRKEFNTRVKSDDFMKVASAYQNIINATPTAAGDMSLIFSYMKLLDPGSTVREGEFANAQNSAGVPQQVINLYNKVLSGTRLGTQQRTQFKNEAKGIYQNATNNFNQQKSYFDELAKTQGVDPSYVTGGFNTSTGQIITAPDGQQIEIID